MGYAQRELPAARGDLGITPLEQRVLVLRGAAAATSRTSVPRAVGARLRAIAPPAATDTFNEVPSPCIGSRRERRGCERFFADADELGAHYERDLRRVVDVTIVACARARVRGDERPAFGAQRLERGGSSTSAA